MGLKMTTMMSLILGVAMAGAMLGADTPYWVEPCSNPETSCVSGDVDLGRWAFEAWQRASNGGLHLVPTADREKALIQLLWATPAQGLYGETRTIMVNGQRGAQIYIMSAATGVKDPLLRDTIVYLTCLHESGHALGLRHTAQFDDIMYTFQYGGDIPEYFGRYRRKLTRREDIRMNSGLSPADLVHLMEQIGKK
jgi:hypothetical protein